MSCDRRLLIGQWGGKVKDVPCGGGKWPLTFRFRMWELALVCLTIIARRLQLVSPFYELAWTGSPSLARERPIGAVRIQRNSEGRRATMNANCTHRTAGSHGMDVSFEAFGKCIFFDIDTCDIVSALPIHLKKNRKTGETCPEIRDSQMSVSFWETISTSGWLALDSVFSKALLS